MLLPGPGRAERVVQIARSLPAQLFVRKRRVGPDGDDVALAAVGNLVVEFQAVGLLEAAHQLQHRDTVARADVEDLVVLLVLALDHARDGHHMGASQIHHVDIVADVRTVGCGVVVAEDREALADAGSGLRHERHKVLRYTARQLTDQSRGVGTDGVEVAQSDTVQVAIGTHRVAQDILAHGLCVAVGRGGRLAGRKLRHGLLVGLAIDRARRREDDVVTAIGAHQLDDVHQRGEVVAVVFERLLHRLAHSLVGGKVNHRVELIFLEQLLRELLLVAAIDLDKGYIDARNLAHALDGTQVAIRQIVGDHYVVARLD